MGPTSKAREQPGETAPDAPTAEEPATPDGKPDKPEGPPAETTPEPAPGGEARNTGTTATEPAAPAHTSRTNRKLDEETVHQIRAAYDGTPESTKNLATLYNVSPQTVRLVALRKRWRQVPALKGEWKP